MIAPRIGRVLSAVNDAVVASLPYARVGEGAFIRPAGGDAVPSIVTRIDGGSVRLSAFAPLHGISAGDAVASDVRANTVPLGAALLGRAIDATGRLLDGGAPVHGRRVNVLPTPIAAAERTPVAVPFWTGIRAVDGLLTIGRGARVGIFGAPGAGKSTLVEMLVRGSSADAVVVGLIGERGREAARWIAEIERHATLVVVPSDRTAAERMRGAHVALAQGAELRARGLNVLVILDSLARFCSAARELAIANGESPGRGGYPPGVFNEMTRLLERGGNVGRGSLTLVATVLSDGGDEREPLTDAARAALDGHIVLSSALARAGHYPAIDILASTSRTMNDVVAPPHRTAAERVRTALATLAETKDARELGLLRATPRTQRAIDAEEPIDRFLRQREPAAAPARTLDDLTALAALLVSAEAAAV